MWPLQALKLIHWEPLALASFYYRYGTPQPSPLRPVQICLPVPPYKLGKAGWWPSCSYIVLFWGTSLEFNSNLGVFLWPKWEDPNRHRCIIVIPSFCECKIYSMWWTWLDVTGVFCSIPSAPEARPAGPIKLILDEYNFSHPRRGKAVIINQKNFDQRLTGQLNRDGTDVCTVYTQETSNAERFHAFATQTKICQKYWSFYSSFLQCHWPF